MSRRSIATTTVLWGCLVLGHAVNGVRAAPSPNSPDASLTSPPAGAGSGGSALPSIPAWYMKVRVAHAVLASVAWLIFFPMGAILVRTLETTRVVQVHYAVQMVGLYLFVAAAGMGIWMAKTTMVLDRYHPIIGMALLGSLALQPLTEVLNHFLYRKYPKVIYLAHGHIWFGRLLITVGIIQGGLGFVFAASLPQAQSDAAPRIAYGVVAVIVWVLYVSLAIVWPEVKHTFGWWRRRHNTEAGEGDGLRNHSLSDLSAPSAIHRTK